MIALIVFDRHDLPIYIYTDGEFSNKIGNIAASLGICSGPDTCKSGLDPTVLMQLFSPALTSYRIMNQQFHNCYHGINCDDGTTVAFYREMDFLLLAVAKQSMNANHLVRVGFEIIQHVCGPSFSLLTHSESHSELTTQLIRTYLELRTNSQSIVTESLHYAEITEETNALLLKHLQAAVEQLRGSSNISVNRIHILILRDTNIVAIYSGKGASELKVGDILFLIIMSNALSHRQEATRNSIIILESCVPYTAHLQCLQNGLNVLILIEAGLRHIAHRLYQIVQDATSSKQCTTIEKQLKEVQKLARKLNYKKWADSLTWRSQLNGNESALSALGRQILFGFESICLDPALLFAAVEHMSAVMEDLQSRIPSVEPTNLHQFTPLLNLYPGLVHFALIDRKSHRLISPILPSVQHVPSLTNLWRMFRTSLDWLNEGMYDLIWDDKELCYSHFIWIENSHDEKLPWKSAWDMQTGILGYPAIIGGDFYENLLKIATVDNEAEPVHYLQFFCIHLGFISPNAATEQATHLVKHLKKFLYPTAMLEDLS